MRRSGIGCSILIALLLIGGIATGILLSPRLQTLLYPTGAAPVTIQDRTSPEQLAAQRQQEQTQLKSYGWLDQQANLAHIPIERAIALVLEKGLAVGIPPTATALPTPTATATLSQAIALAEATATSTSGAEPQAANNPPNYQDDILPIFTKYCGKCHGADEPEEELELTKYKTTLIGSLNGPVIVPGDPDQSELVKQMVNGKMPKRGDPVPPAEIEIVKAWIKAGAPETGATNSSSASSTDATVTSTATATRATAPTPSEATATSTTTPLSTVTPSPIAVKSGRGDQGNEEQGDENQKEASQGNAAQVTYQDHILPIFEQHCGKCHGADEPDEQLELTRYKTTMIGSVNGPVIVPGDPDQSYLVELVVKGKMPKKGDPLSQAEIDLIIAWIQAGAPEKAEETGQAAVVPTETATKVASAVQTATQTATQTAIQTPTPSPTVPSPTVPSPTVPSPTLSTQSTAKSQPTATKPPSATPTSSPTKRATATQAASGARGASATQPTATPTVTPTVTLTVTLTATSVLTSTGERSSSQSITYQEQILPIFEQHCGKCHGADEPDEELELTRYKTTMIGSLNGPVIVPGDPDKSYLVELYLDR